MGSCCASPFSKLRRGILLGSVAVVLLLGQAAPASAASCSQTLTDSLGYQWDIKTENLGVGYGNQNGGGWIDVGGTATVETPINDEAYDGWGVLKVGATIYNPPVSPNCLLEEGGRELHYADAQTVGALEVTRKVYVPSGGTAFARFLDIIKNPVNSGGAESATITYEGDLGSDAATKVLARSPAQPGCVDNNPATRVAPCRDRWAASAEDPALDSPPDPTVAHVFDGPGQSVPTPLQTPGPFGGAIGTAVWQNVGEARVRAVYNVSIPEGETYIFMHLEAQRSTQQAAIDTAEALGDLELPGGDAFTGMSEFELASLRNWGSSDLDGDTVTSPGDNCRFVTNASQANFDSDLAGDACDSDDDNDGLSDATEAAVGTNPLSSDSDGDGKADGVDSCPLVAGAGADGCTAASSNPGPSPLPGPAAATPDKTPPRVTLTVPSKVKLKSFIKGLTVAARINETASLKFELLGAPPPRRKARTRAKAFTRVLARQSLAMAGAGLRATRLRPSKKLVGKAKKFVVQLRVTATDRAGNKTVVRRTIKVR